MIAKELTKKGKNTLILTVGLPRSGKSSWAKKQGVPLISLDAIRLAVSGKRFDLETEPEVWRVAPIIIKSLFNAGNKIVILDATNNTKARRDGFKNEAWESVFLEFDTDKEICKKRAIKTNQEDLLPVIDRMHTEKEPISKEEGEVYYYKFPKIEDYKQVSDFAQAVAKEAHQGQCRKDGVTPYFNHVQGVANTLKSEDEITVAYLHDIIEDTEFKQEDLIDMGFSTNIVDAVYLLTKKEGEDYEEYIKKIKNNKLATKVKLADMNYNLSDEPSKKQAQKYKKSIEFLKDPPQILCHQK